MNKLVSSCLIGLVLTNTDANMNKNNRCEFLSDDITILYIIMKVKEKLLIMSDIL